MEIRYSKQATKILNSCGRNIKQNILNKILGLTENPPKGDIKPLKGSKTENRLRVGKYRVVYEYLSEYEIKILMINKIDSRGDIYK
ncbi:MAG: type II toxin-antitoxin system RelE/ParE family toxin [Defluviitaleaceae bacterium]|nr:type II toxin-antitoxin system RelE/ParE family toxin [Defluviitaleaceae bacterium]